VPDLVLGQERRHTEDRRVLHGDQRAGQHERPESDSVAAAGQSERLGPARQQRQQQHHQQRQRQQYLGSIGTTALGT